MSDDIQTKWASWDGSPIIPLGRFPYPKYFEALELSDNEVRERLFRALLHLTTPPESSERSAARKTLLERAQEARKAGRSFVDWAENEDKELTGLVTEKDLDALFRVIWGTKKRWR